MEKECCGKFVFLGALEWLVFSTFKVGSVRVGVRLLVKGACARMVPQCPSS